MNGCPSSYSPCGGGADYIQQGTTIMGTSVEGGTRINFDNVSEIMKWVAEHDPTNHPIGSPPELHIPDQIVDNNSALDPWYKAHARTSSGTIILTPAECQQIIRDHHSYPKPANPSTPHPAGLKAVIRGPPLTPLLNSSISVTGISFGNSIIGSNIHESNASLQQPPNLVGSTHNSGHYNSNAPTALAPGAYEHSTNSSHASYNGNAAMHPPSAINTFNAPSSIRNPCTVCIPCAEQGYERSCDRAVPCSNCRAWGKTILECQIIRTTAESGYGGGSSGSYVTGKLGQVFEGN